MLLAGVCAVLFLILGPAQSLLSQSIAAPRPTLSSDVHKLLVLTPSGPMSADIGPGLVVTARPGGLTISAQAAAPPALVHRILSLDPASTTKTITATGCMLYFRNGVAMLEGATANYIRTPTGIQIMTEVEAGDQWSALCN